MRIQAHRVHITEISFTVTETRYQYNNINITIANLLITNLHSINYTVRFLIPNHGFMSTCDAQLLFPCSVNM